MADHLDEELRVIARGLPPSPTIKPHAGNGASPGYDFEELGQRIAEGMLQAANEQFVQAENMLKQTEMFAEDIRARVASKATELADMNNRLRTFASTIVTAHKVFCGEPDAN